MPEKEMNPQAGNARRFRITAEVGETAVEILLPTRLPKGRQPKDYKIIKKDIPESVKGLTYGGVTVLWINNFGLRIRGNFTIKKGGTKQDPFIDEVEGEQFDYEVIVPGPPPKGYATLVYFDGTNVQPASATIDSSNNFHFNLNIGDPPTGWGGG